MPLWENFEIFEIIRCGKTCLGVFIIRENYSPGKIIRYLTKISSLFPDEVFPDMVINSINKFIQNKTIVNKNPAYLAKKTSYTWNDSPFCLNPVLGNRLKSKERASKWRIRVPVPHKIARDTALCSQCWTTEGHNKRRVHILIYELISQGSY